MKKLFALLPIIGLILGAVAIATEIRTPMSIGQTFPKNTTITKNIDVSTTIQVCSLDTITPLIYKIY